MAEQEPWPSLEDPKYIHLTQQYASRLCKRTSMVLRSAAHGFIACKFSALSFLLTGILWLDRTKTEEEKIAIMTHFDITRIGSFQNKRLDHIFMINQREDPSIEILRFEDIVFEDGIALLGIVEEDGYKPGQIYHYFLVRQGPSGTYSILSSYGSDLVSIYQYETTVQPSSFTTFVKSLKKDKRHPTAIVKRIDIPRIHGFMRAHFLNPRFKLTQPKSKEFTEMYDASTERKLFSKNNPEDITAEIKKYTGMGSTVVQFTRILPEIHRELELIPFVPVESPDQDYTAEIIEQQHAAQADAEEEEIEEAKREVEEEALEKVERGGRKTKRERKSRRTKYVTIRKKTKSINYCIKNVLRVI